MSGGHFDYNCFRISQFADDLQHEIDLNDDETSNKFGDRRGYHFAPDTLRRLKIAHCIIEKAGRLAKEIEWLYSSDHGEGTFNDLVDELLGEGNEFTKDMEV